MTIAPTRPQQLDLTAFIPRQRTVSDPARPHGCGGCPARWSGTRTSHCGAAGCHVSFAGVSLFDRHRVNGHCVPPARLGMSLLPGRPYPCWGYPTEETA
jgi:hypothetical protein